MQSGIPLRDGAGNTALLVIVPRHPQRFDDVARLAPNTVLPCSGAARTVAIDATTGVLLGDSMGEMFAYYAAADLASSAAACSRQPEP
jgi:3-deoxy-D-manno-octulosonic-acid transferase